MPGTMTILCYKCNKVIAQAILNSIAKDVEVLTWCKDCIGFVDKGIMRAHSTWKANHPYNTNNTRPNTPTPNTPPTPD